ncbi:MAG: hypothetical protein IJJ43_00320 [Oscillospiraceae bacterium]|nr:hypothetical protein [Oscillospiraceae bacterium]
MRVKCEYCGNFIEDTDAACPQCGAPNNQMQRSGSGVPKTIEELKAFCAARSLPLERMRFFLGQDYRGPRAYGVYRDGDGCFVVYKNKSDGSRAVRYRGTDEAYAVNEIYQKLKSEVAQQRSYQASRGAPARDRYKNPNNPYNYPSGSYQTRSGSGQRARGVSSRRRRKRRPLLWIIVGFIVFCMIYSQIGDKRPGQGYYNYNGNYYYSQNDQWYAYDDVLSDWILTDVDDELENNYSEYYESSSYSDDYGIDSFYSSGYYDPDAGSSSSYGSDYDYDYDYSYDDYDSDWDDDYDWDWGGSDWDSGGSDWDSDW